MRFLMLNWRDPKNPLAGGAERVSMAHLAALAKRGHEIFWFANAFPNCLPEETIENIRFIRGGGKGTSILKAIQWYRRQKPFDLVIDQHHGLPWYAPWWCRTHCIAYIHEVLGPIWDSFYPWPLSSIGRAQERWTHWLYRNVQFWTVTQATRRCLEANGAHRVKVMLNGINTVALPVLPEKSLKLPLRLAMVSRLAPNKRIDHGIRTVKRLNDVGIETKMTIVGTGEVETQLHALVDQLKLRDQITFTGPLPEAEKDARLRDAHFLVHTSLREGWGLNVIEANANGTPGAVYPVEGLTESTLHDQTGIVSDVETPESLTTALAAVIKAPEKYDRYRLAAWHRAKALHWDKVLPPACDWLESQARGEK